MKALIVAVPKNTYNNFMINEKQNVWGKLNIKLCQYIDNLTTI